MGDKDIISKDLLKEMAKDISRHILHIEIDDNMELIDKEFTRIEKRDADLVYKNGDEIVHIEIQNNNHAKMHLRMHRYFSDILFEYETYTIKQYMLYIGKERCTMKREIVRDNINYKYAIIDIRDVSCEAFLQSNDPSAIVLAILCNFEDKDKQEVVNSIIKKLIELSDDEATFRNYLKKVEVFSTNRNLEEYVDKGEKMFTVDIEKLPSFQRGMEQGLQKGIEESMKLSVQAIASLGYDAKKIAELLKLTEAEVKAYMK